MEIKYGKKKNPEYRVWRNMICRCQYASSGKLRSYGDRGIRVCARWRNSFEAFLADMGPRPSAKYSIDRRNNDLGYNKANCRWALRKDQDRNRQGNRFVTIGGATKIVSDWCAVYGIHKVTVAQRERRGWDIVRALTTPLCDSHGKPRS